MLPRALLIPALVVTALAADTKEARALKVDFQNLTARAVSMTNAVDAMDRRLRAQGLALRSDISAARTRMELTMDESEEALKAGRLKDARRAMKRADGAIEKLESAMGAR